jgi:hypothetical protein
VTLDACGRRNGACHRARGGLRHPRLFLHTCSPLTIRFQ